MPASKAGPCFCRTSGFVLPPHRHEFVDDLLSLDGEALRLAVFDRDGHLAVAHAGLVFHRDQAQKLEHNALAAFHVFGG